MKYARPLARSFRVFAMMATMMEIIGWEEKKKKKKKKMVVRLRQLSPNNNLSNLKVFLVMARSQEAR